MPVPSPAIAVIDDAVARAEIGAAKAVAGHQHHAADAGRRRCAARFGDAFDGERRRLRRRARAASSTATSGRSRIEQVEVGKVVRQQRRDRRGPAKWSSGATRAIATARSASASAPLPFMSLVETTAWRWPTSTRRPMSSPSARSRFLDRAVAHFDRQRHRAHRDRIGRIGAGAPRGRDQAFGKVEQGGLIEKR